MKKLIVALAFVCAAAGESASWKSEGPYFGTIHDIEVDPSNPETLYAATHGGGVWKSTDGGASWKLAGKELADRVVVWVEIDPKNSKKLFAGVEESTVAQSKDGGETWKFLRMPYTLSQIPQRLSFVPGKTGGIWLADRNNSYRSADGGATWTDFDVPEIHVRVFRFHPSNPKIIWAGGTGTTTGLSKSVDGGATWKKIGKGLDSSDVRDLMVDPSNPDVLYMKTGRAAYKSIDGGENWTMLSGEVEDKEIEAMALDPSSPETLYVATDEALFKSTDGGESWADIDYGLPPYVVQTITVHSSDSSRLWVGAGSTGVYRSSDGGKKWTASNDGLAASWIERVWGDSSGLIFAQASLGLFRKDPGGGWTEIRKPLSSEGKAQIRGRLLFDKKNPRVIHVGNGSSYFRSADGGKTWTESSKFFLEPTPDLDSLVIDPENPRIQYATGPSSDSPMTAVMKSIDGGAKWKASGKGLTKGIKLLRSESAGKLIAVTKDEVWTSSDAAGTWSKSSGLLGKEIVDLVIDLANPARVFAATKEAVFRSEDGGASWTKLEKAPKEDVTSVAIASAVFVGTRDGVFRSDDNGVTWSESNEGLLNRDVMALSAAGKRIYAGIAGGGVFSIELE